MISEDTLAYLDGYGTEAQQQTYQDAADTLATIYDRRYPDDPEDRADMIADQLVGAAMYALGDATLESLGDDMRAKYAAYMDAKDHLQGAVVAAREQGIPVTKIAEKAGVSRATANTYLGQ